MFLVIVGLMVELVLKLGLSIFQNLISFFKICFSRNRQWPRNKFKTQKTEILGNLIRKEGIDREASDTFDREMYLCKRGAAPGMTNSEIAHSLRKITSFPLSHASEFTHTYADLHIHLQLIPDACNNA